MKKILSIIFSLSLMVLVACSGEKPLVTADGIENGVKIHVELYGNKDNIEKLNQTNTHSLPGIPEEEIDKRIEEAKDKLNENTDLPIEYNIKRDGSNVIEDYTITFTNKEDNHKLIRLNLLKYFGKIEDNLKVDPFLTYYESRGYKIEKNY